MPRFIKKPVVVEAVQYFPDQPIPDGVKMGNLGVGSPEAYIVTLEGILSVRSGDWIITGTRGERYPCKPEIFAEIYEPVKS